MSGRGRLHLALLVLLAALLLVAVAAERDPTVPNFEFLPEMVRTTRFNAYSENPYFADGKTLQLPPPGTIPRGWMPLGYAPTEADAARAGRELANPFRSDDPEALARGDAVYRNFCLPCHGAGGTGDGPVVRRGYPAPTSLFSDTAMKMADGEMFHIVTYGKGNMAGYAALISRDDRWRAILFIRSMQQKQQAAAAAPPPAAPAASAPVRGER